MGDNPESYVFQGCLGVIFLLAVSIVVLAIAAAFAVKMFEAIV